jgi:hypothetical protein
MGLKSQAAERRMLDLLSNADLWNKVLTLLVGVVTLITAFITLRKSRAEKAQVEQVSSVKLRSFRASEASPIWRWMVTTTLVVVAIVSVVMVIWAGALAYREQDWAAVLPLAYFGACTLVLARALWIRWKGQGWTISREATLNIQGNYDQVMENCIAALRKMKVRLTAIDSKNGLVEGKTRVTWRSFREIIVIRITETGPGEYAVHVKSRCAIEGTLIDWGKNASNVNRILRRIDPLRWAIISAARCFIVSPRPLFGV